MYHLTNVTPANVARSLGRAAAMRPYGLVNIMFLIPATQAEIKELQLQCHYGADGHAFFSEGLTCGEVVNGKLLVMLPLVGGTHPSYRPCWINVAAMSQLTVDGVGADCWEEETTSLRRFHYRCRKALRSSAKELAHA